MHGRHPIMFIKAPHTPFPPPTAYEVYECKLFSGYPWFRHSSIPSSFPLNIMETN